MATAPRPPTIDPVAAARWERVAPPASPWLHEEVGRRMEERLEWIRRQPQAWAHWEAVRGGLDAHRRIAVRYPSATCQVLESTPARAEAARKALAVPWWRRGASAEVVPALRDAGAEMLWANMLLHLTADPGALLARWHRALAPDGFVMFSCLGPDTLRALRELYAECGWPPPTHDFTDMHDWGDLLVETGFAEPVMDMERVSLSFESPARALGELAELGTNLHPARFGALRGRAWKRALDAALDRLRPPGGGIELQFEIVYGHALKPLGGARVRDRTDVPLEDLRAMLRQGRRPDGPTVP